MTIFLILMVAILTLPVENVRPPPHTRAVRDRTEWTGLNFRQLDARAQPNPDSQRSELGSI